MRTTVLKRSLTAGVALSASLGSFMLAPQAQAQSAAGTTTWASPDVMIMAAGSDTTENMMKDIMPLHDGDAITTTLGAGVLHTFNLPSFQTTATLPVDGDAACPQHVWNKQVGNYTNPPTQWTSPAGSSAGRDYLRVQETYPAGERGCVDIARSSSGPRSLAAGLDKSTFEYYAYALDSMAWATPSLKAPANLSRQNLQDIYSCAITNWNDPHLGTTIPAATVLTTGGSGSSGPIQRYLAQAGSGTRAFFISAFGITQTMIDTTNASCPPTKESTSVPVAATAFEENQGNTIDYADYDKAILPYSSAVWSFQYANKLNPTVDKRNGVRLGGFVTNPGSGSQVKSLPVLWNSVSKRYRLDGAVVNENAASGSGFACAVAADCYNGVRYVYNVLDNLNNQPGYQAAFGIAGFANTAGGAMGAICDDAHFGEIFSNYYQPLDRSNPNGRNDALSTCRKVPLAP